MSIPRGVGKVHRRRRIGLSTPTFFLETANEIDEFISGPLSATPPVSNPLDPTINATYLYNESKIFNFGHVMVQENQMEMSISYKKYFGNNNIIKNTEGL